MDLGLSIIKIIKYVYDDFDGIYPSFKRAQRLNGLKTWWASFILGFIGYVAIGVLLVRLVLSLIF